MPDKVSRGKKRGELPTRICLQCQRPFNWRAKWEKVWDEVRRLGYAQTKDEMRFICLAYWNTLLFPDCLTLLTCSLLQVRFCSDRCKREAKAAKRPAIANAEDPGKEERECEGVAEEERAEEGAERRETRASSEHLSERF